MDNFWKDKEAGIDYQGFMRIFNKYKFKDDSVSNVRSVKGMSEGAVRRKKMIFDNLRNALNNAKASLEQVFKKVDKDGSGEIDQAELQSMFAMMKQSVDQNTC